jgi:hypothetical protein
LLSYFLFEVTSMQSTNIASQKNQLEMHVILMSIAWKIKDLVVMEEHEHVVALILCKSNKFQNTI